VKDQRNKDARCGAYPESEKEQELEKEEEVEEGMAKNTTCENCSL
jgi:hypothetical protein